MTLIPVRSKTADPLWDEMVREYGAEEAERILRRFGVEIR